MKKVYVIFAIVAAVLLIVAVWFRQSNCTLKEQLSIAKANEKALLMRNDTLQENSRTLQLTVDQLNYSNDYVLKDLNDMRNKLNIKDKDLKSLQSLKSVITKTDTLVFTDTIFKTPKVDIDTIIGDAWYTMRMRLKHPNVVTMTPKFISKKYITVYNKKETVNPPKKFFLFRWFQRKHKVLTVVVTEQNPYINDSVNQYVEIVN